MANYTEIQGQNILIVSSDPANPIEGQIWYNSTTNLLKGYQNVIVAANWATGGTANSNKAYSNMVGIQTAALGFGGFPISTASESYNGTSWTSTSPINTGRYYMGSSGTQTAALTFGGAAPPNISATESWNGTSWTTLPANMNTARYGLSSGQNGTQTATIGFGGTNTGTSTDATFSESWNGSTWTNVGSLATGIMYGVGMGTQTAAIFTAGGPTHVSQSSALTQLWNGTSWANLPSGHNLLNAGPGRMGFGIATSALIVGQPAPAVEQYNGTTWTNTTAMPGSRVNPPAATGADTSAGLIVGNTTGTLEWNGPSVALATRTITSS